MKKAVVALISNAEGKILAVSRKDNHQDFGLIGGKCDENETNEQAIVREVKEETGLHFYDIKPIFTQDCLGGDTDYSVTTFIGKISGEINVTENLVVDWVKPRVLLQGSFRDYNMMLFSQIYEGNIL